MAETPTDPTMLQLMEEALVHARKRLRQSVVTTRDRDEIEAAVLTCLVAVRKEMDKPARTAREEPPIYPPQKLIEWEDDEDEIVDLGDMGCNGA